MESEKGSLNKIKILYAIMFLFTGAFVFAAEVKAEAATVKLSKKKVTLEVKDLMFVLLDAGVLGDVW